MKKVLIVDDEAEIRQNIKLLIESRFKCKILEASDGHEAARKLYNDNIDVLITDLRMPKSSGIGLIRQIQFLKDDQKPKGIVIISGSIDDLISEELGHKGILALSKPFNEDVLVSHLGKFLET